MQNVIRFVGKPIILLSIFFLTFIGLEAQKKKSLIKDTIRVGTQMWMRKNLNVDKFRNGTKIPQAKTREEWVKAGILKKPAWCYTDNDPIVGMKMYKLYNWYAATDKRGLAPKGWAIPSLEDWVTFRDEVKKDQRNNKKLQSDSPYWQSDEEDEDSSEDGYDERKREKERMRNRKKSVFFAEPAGGRIYIKQGRDNDNNDEDGFFGGFRMAKWWSSTEEETKEAWSFSVGNDELDKGNLSKEEKGFGFSIRCIKK